MECQVSGDTVYDSTCELDFDPKINEQWLSCNSVHCRATDARFLDHNILVDWYGFRLSSAFNLQDNMR